MFILHSSNQTEQLAESLACTLSRDGSSSLFEQEIFLIQSRGMERMLSQYLAEYFGVWCNARYLLPVQFVEYVSKLVGLTVDDQIFHRDMLTWQLEAVLRDLNDPSLHPLSAYLSGEQSSLKRFQLARQLANIFDQYQIMRMDLLDRWESGRLLTDDDSEIWQKTLWHKLRASLPGVFHRGEILSRLLLRLREMARDELILPRRIFVFGLHTMPPLFLSSLNMLSQKLDVHLFLLAPCEMYWGDIESKRVRARRALTSGRRSHLESNDELDFHPLLVSFGRQGADFQELLLDQLETYSEGEASFVDPCENQPNRLLQQLQSDILAGVDPGQHTYLGECADTSVQVMSCHSRIRELMILRDQILAWMYKDPSLDLHEIIVMVPDIKDYAQLIPALFKDIHHTIADRNARKENRYLDLFLQFLALFSGRFGWDEIFSLLENHEISTQFSMSAGDLETVRHWVIEAGIRWGLSDTQRGETSGIDDVGTWRFGLERMLMGYAIDTEDEIADILPFTAIEGGNGELLGGLCSFIDIIDRKLLLFASEKTLAQWSDELRSLRAEIFTESDNPDLLLLDHVLVKMKDSYSAAHQSPVSFLVIQRWLQSVVETSSSGGFLSGTMTFCSMLPMRSIPFRIICLLGLNDGEFPKQDHLSTFDLMGREYRRGDRSNRADDRYQFLEAIIAARERLYLSYVGQSIRTNKKIPPSVVISELLECLQLNYGIDDLIEHHPLQPFNKKYFTPDSSFFSYDKNFCQVAVNLQEGQGSETGKWLQGELDQEKRSTYDFSELVRFFSQPQVYFVRYILGINLHTEKMYPASDEPFRLDPLSRYSVDQEIVASLLQGVDRQSILRRVQADSHWPLGTPGRISFNERVRGLDSFVQRISDFDLGDAIDDIRLAEKLEHILLEGYLSHCYQNGQLLYRYASLKGKDLLLGWLYHLVAARVRAQKCSTFVLAQDYVVVFDMHMGSDEDLELLIDCFLAGQNRVSNFLVEPAFAYARQHALNRGRGKKIPLDVARQAYRDSIENNYVPAWNLVYRNQSEEEVLDSDFEALCHQLMIPLWDNAHVLEAGDGK